MCRGVAGKGCLHSIHTENRFRRRHSMSYQVLARKWRPGNFSQVAGQSHVLKSLINALDNQRLHHAYLFTGTRGVGKTTLARVLAKCLNCEEGITSVPCESCDSCTEISEGRFIDLIEVDAASRSKVEGTRELLDNVQYAPSRGRFKVYLIDEVHMLSTHSFNALLKTLEEPPPHVKFLFATTDPQKLPITVLSRCLQFNLKNLSPQLITKYLGSVLEKEQIDYEETALWQIAVAAAGSMRDALTLVDQAISYCEGKVVASGVIEMLGVPPQQQVYELLKSMASRSVAAILELIRDISEQTPDYGHTLDNLLSTLHRIAIAQINPKAVDNSYGDMSQIVELAALISPEDVQLYYQMGVKGREDLRLSAEVRTAFEMLLIRMLVFSPGYVEPVSIEETQQAENSVKTVDEASAKQKKKPKLETELKSEQVNDRPELNTKECENLSAAVEALEEKKSEEEVPVEDGFKETALHPTAIASLDRKTWLSIFPQLSLSGIAANVLANSDFVKSDSQNVYFVLDHSQSAVYSEDLLAKISQCLSNFFASTLTVHIEIGETRNETPALISQRLKEECQTEMINEFEQDENVQELLGHFSGTLVKESIAPNKD